MGMLSTSAMQPRPLRAVASAAESVAPPAPPPLPSMRVPKGTRPHDDDDSDVEREWSLRAAETKARLEAAEEREWKELLARVNTDPQALDKPAAQPVRRQRPPKLLKAQPPQPAARIEPPAPSRAPAGDEESEWRALRDRALAATRENEEREWQEHMKRIRSVAPPAAASGYPFDAPRPTNTPQVPARIVQWP